MTTLASRRRGTIRCQSSLKFDHNGKNFAGVYSLMKSRCLATVLPLLAVLATGCTTTASSNQQATATSTYLLHAPERSPYADAASRPPRLTVGTSYSDTQLILPWFLNDLIDFVNYR
jgi:hypothetical protein